MSTGVGDQVEASGEATAPVRGPESPWPGRVQAAFGGAAVLVWLLVLGSAWSTGLRPSTFDALRSDLATGSVTQWYAASALDKGILDLAHAEQAGLAGGAGEPGWSSATADPDGLTGPADSVEGQEFVTPEGFPDGGLLVWRTYGRPGWSVASPTGSVHPAVSAGPTEESTALVRQLREAEVPMKPFEFTDRSPLELVYLAGGVLLFARWLFGPAPRVGTKWFWFWLFIGTPLALGAVAYAVTELIGLRRRPDRPLDRRFRGIFGFLASVLVALAVGLAAQLLRSRGVPLPF